MRGRDEITLYHGSEEMIERPVYGKGKRTNDYGRGFYCTEDKELAKEWACRTGKDGYISQYRLDCRELNFMNFNSPEYNILNWLALLTDNRTYWQKSSISEQAKAYLRDNFLVDISGFDVITGYRADDSYFSFAQDFVAGVISLRQLTQAMYLGKLGEQIVLKSPKAFEQISFLTAESADAEVYFIRKRDRDLEARRAYRRTKREADMVQDLFMIDIMREGIRGNDPRLR